MGFISGLLIGGLLGAAGGYLWAPRSGAETLNQIRNRSNEIKREIKASAAMAQVEAENVADQLRYESETEAERLRAHSREHTPEAATYAAVRSH